MAYNYTPTYLKRRQELINIRKALKIGGVPSDFIPSLPKKYKNPTKQQAKQMENLLREAKITLEAKHEAYLRRSNFETQRTRIVTQREQTKERRKQKKAEEYRKKIIDMKPYYSLYIGGFEERLEKIPRFTTRGTGVQYFGRDTIMKWWSTMKSMLSNEQLSELLDSASMHGLTLNIEELYDGRKATAFVNEMIDFLRVSGIVTKDEYDEITEELDYVNESGWEDED